MHQSQLSDRWEFWIDVGGTFTDCIARSPAGPLHQCKTLSSGVTKGRVAPMADQLRITDPLREGDPVGFWTGYRIEFFDSADQALVHATTVAQSDSDGSLQLVDAIPADASTDRLTYQLASDEEAPIVAVRRILQLPLAEPIPDVDVKLGTTRGTNALLTRTGARTVFVTTKGMADVLLIGNQDRPRLFDLAITKPTPLFERVIEVDERLDADGNVLRPLNEKPARVALTEAKAAGIESVAICLLHAFANGDHEAAVEQIARECGFDEVSVSSKLSPLIKIVSRGDTTVMDAYLNPILRQYVAGLKRSLGDGSRLKLMTSAGGLVDADRFVGKDSVLSGPAGGVIGFSKVAQRAGFKKSIGFDMGGTSTDVSRFDGTYEREFETKKAGVRVVAPMLAIETVAAGGGSVCHFDGVKLAVGPQSAGADPGPACYGRGGPLTVTDVNLFLGKIPPSRFPFPLDLSAVARRLESLCAEVPAREDGSKFTAVELAEGFVQIANASMERAIRRISVAKGYDPSDYALVTFGGAGAQHACALADSLGIDSVLVHPFAGILSAYGIGMADVRRFREESVLRRFDAALSAELDSLFERLEAAARQEVLDDGVLAERIEPPQRSLDLRYIGLESTINVPCPADGDYIARYGELHQQLYGYRHSGRDVEVTAARVEVVGKMPEDSRDETTPHARQPEPVESRDVYFHGQWQSAGVFDRNDLQAGDIINGPAIVCESTSTILIDPGFRAELLSGGEFVIRRPVGQAVPADVRRTSSPSNPTTDWKSVVQEPEARVPSAANPVLLEIFNNLFASIAEQMGVTLQQTSCSTNVKERLDFSCAIFSPTGDLVVNAPHIPVHLGAMGETVKRIIADNPQMFAGDVFVTNDPYRGGSHLPDVTVITPVHHAASGKLQFFTASRAHHAEIGGIVPGSMPPFSKNLGEEGVLIRNFKLVDQGESREAQLRELLTSGTYPTRSVEDNMSDVTAQVAANNLGVRLLNDLIDRYSLEVVQAYMSHIQAAAAKKMRMALAKRPDGEYRFTDHLDDGSPIIVCIRITGEQAVVDFTGTGPVLSTNLNANRAITTAAVLYVFRCLIDEDIPLNAGVLEPVEIITPDCLLNPRENVDPAKSAAVVGGNVETSQRVVDTLLGALGLAAASQGTMNNLTFGDDTFGYYETICGGSGATSQAAGADAVHTHMTNTRLTDVEIIERRYPVRVEEFSIRTGSGGEGEHRGGDGIIRKLRFLRPLKVSMLSERRGEFRPFGLEQGSVGEGGTNKLLRGNNPPQDLGGKFAIEVQPDDVLIIKSPGGGGYSPSVPSRHT